MCWTSGSRAWSWWAVREPAATLPRSARSSTRTSPTSPRSRTRLSGLDACFYCLGVSSSGRSEDEYRRITYDYTLAAARALARRSPGLTFTYVSGEGTDSTERGRRAWARVKGRTENELLAMDFPAYMFRPGYIRPRDGARSRTAVYRLMYDLTSWLYPLLRRLMPAHVTTTEHLGRAMLAVVALRGAEPHVLYSPEINRLGA